MKYTDFEIFSEIVKALEKIKGGEISLSSMSPLFYDLAEIVAMKYDFAKRQKGDGLVDLLAILGSFGDTLSDDEILDYLKAWNEKGQIFTKIFAKAESPSGLYPGGM